MPDAFCPACLTYCRVRADQLGRRVICPKCGSKFTAVRTPGKRIGIAGTLLVVLLAVAVIVLAALRLR
jgi:predicted Zn finger-like uncharacterized protein